MAKWVFFLWMLFVPFAAFAGEGPCFDTRHSALGAEILRMPGMRAWAWQAIQDQVVANTTWEQRALIYAAPRPALVALINFQKQCWRLLEAEKRGKKIKAETPAVTYVISVIRQQAAPRGLDPAAVLAAIFKQLMEDG